MCLYKKKTWHIKDTFKSLIQKSGTSLICKLAILGHRLIVLYAKRGFYFFLMQAALWEAFLDISVVGDLEATHSAYQNEIYNPQDSVSSH